MSEFKGTKGKWVFRDNFPERSIYDDCGCKLFSVERTSSIESQVDTEQKANAKLISCTPEMLELLQYLNNCGGLGFEKHARIEELITKATTI